MSKIENVSARVGHGFDRIPGLPCRSDPDLFFPGPGGNGEAIATSRCQERCPITVECLSFALRTGQKFGVWGGVGSEARERMDHAEREAVHRQARPLDALLTEMGEPPD